MNDFKSFELKDREYLEKFFLKENNLRFCEFNFTNLYCWGEIYKILWKEFNNSILMYNGLEDVIYFPLGDEFEVKDIINISDSMIKQGKTGNYMFVPHYYIEKYKEELSDDFNIIADENNFDYIYLTEKLAFLKGRKLSKKRNLISQFERNIVDYKSELLKKEYSEECLKLARKWCEERICDLLGFTEEMSAIRRVFDNFNKLSVEGIVVKVDGKIEAFSIFSKLYEDCYDIHFEKYNSSIKGIAQIINKDTAVYLNDKCQYINREQDMGILGLKKSKRSYYPDLMPKSYILERKSKEICK
ncbi:MAG: phosphatidylglycerol lysyltransferase domain-containing protein [Candidatus Muirbacterium halophilum]|nr:phosphatidylglycerol lysyltransferase domain-containing protein [Candidatus Muirbacterium halophilum]MCK9474951.1 phosphatidylglycerol lysyltransferase domain-containing protein [Candidatus Muirbacterium halophilum]